MSDSQPSTLCSANQRGHQPHRIQVNLLYRSPDYKTPVAVREVLVAGETAIRIVRADGSATTFSNHNPARARAAWEAHPEGAVLYPGKDLLAVRYKKEIDGKVYEAGDMFSLCLGGYRTCDELAASFRAAREGPPTSAR